MAARAVINGEERIVPGMTVCDAMGEAVTSIGSVRLITFDGPLDYCQHQDAYTIMLGSPWDGEIANMIYDQFGENFSYSSCALVGAQPITINGTQRIGDFLNVLDAAGEQTRQIGMAYFIDIRAHDGWGLTNGRSYTIGLPAPWSGEKDHMAFDMAARRFTFTPPAPPPMELPRPSCVGNAVQMKAVRGDTIFQVTIEIPEKTWSRANQEFQRKLSYKWAQWETVGIPIVTQKKGMDGVKRLTTNALELKIASEANRFLTADNVNVGEGAVWLFDLFTDKS